MGGILWVSWEVIGLQKDIVKHVVCFAYFWFGKQGIVSHELQS